MSKYAKHTRVPIERSQAEIQKILKKYGASKFGLLDQGENACIAFEAQNRRIRFILPLEPGHDQTNRSRWRCLVLVIKAKLECIDTGLETFEEAFMPHIILPNGRTISEWVTPQLEKTYEHGKMPPLLGYDG